MSFWAVLIGLLVVAAASGAPLGAALGLTGFVILELFAGGATGLALDRIWNTLTSFTLSAIPVFILMGEVLLESGVSRRVYDALAPVFRRLPGGLLHTNIAVCTVFGAVSGSSLSTAAAVGSVAYPEMAARGYDRRLVVGSLAGGGTLGLLIPPSLSLLIFGALTETSIGQLFLAGLVPGLIGAVAFMVYLWARCRRAPHLAPPDTSAVPLGRILRGLADLWPVAVLIGAVMGSIVAGLATPTEAAGLGLAASIVIGAVVGDLTPRRLVTAFLRGVRTFGAIGFVIVGAVILAQSVSILAVPQSLLAAIRDTGLGPAAVLVLVVAVYLGLGLLFEGLSLMIMTLPIVFPLLTGLGYDPVWVGVLVTIMIEVGMITPPVGLNLSVLTALTEEEVGLGEAARAAMPYWAILLGLVALLAVAPGLATALPAWALR